MRHACRCSTQQIANYRSRISGPLLDRMDIQIEVPAVPYKELLGQHQAEPSASIRKRVLHAREIQKERYDGAAIYCNSQMSSKSIQTHCRIKSDAETLLTTAIDRLKLSARAYYRILKLARTIADLEGQDGIQASHIAEAIQYRSLDRGTLL